ncbi:hypothetical protein NSP_14250 [Nodularia spumigena CCY9414]|nr:hypothetical protein NSP_14250 [Nodularia spumigena CCY9414]
MLKSQIKQPRKDLVKILPQYAVNLVNMKQPAILLIYLSICVYFSVFIRNFQQVL